MRTLKRLFVAAITGILLLPSFAARAASAQQDTTLCNALSSGTARIYDQSAAAVAACGYRVFPLSSVATRQDGGKEYTFLVDGHPNIIDVPPPGFDPTTATASQLSDYGFPDRPANASYLPAWTAEVTPLRIATPPGFLVELDISGAPINQFWDGYVDTASSNAYSQSYMDFREPFTYSICSGDAVYDWTGLGGYTGYPLAQIGTGSGGGLSPHEVWTEILPDEGGAVPQYQYASYGDELRARVKWNGGSYDLTITDVTQNWTFSDHEPTSSYNGKSADFITERPLTSVYGSPLPLREFDTLSVYAAQAAQGGATYGVQTWPHTSIAMVNSNNVALATVTALSGDSFTNGWKQCS